MLIKKLSLENFCCHRFLEVEFRPGINGIVGPNGSGKSSILDALRDAIADYSIGDGSRSDNLTYGEKSGKITVEFEDAGALYTMERLVGKSGRRLHTPEWVFSKRDEINEFIEGITGTTIDALLNNIFVPQGAIDSILFSTHVSRLKEMQNTVGLVQASDAEKALGIETNKYTVSVGLPEQINQVKETIVSQESEISHVSAKLSEADRIIAILEPSKEVLEKAVRVRYVLSQLEKFDEDISNLEVTLSEEAKQLEKSAGLLQSVVGQIEAVRELAEESQKELLAYEVDKASMVRRENIVNKLGAVKASLLKFESELTIPSDTEIDALAESYGKGQATLETRQKMLEGSVKMPVHPEEQKFMDEHLRLKGELAALGSSRSRTEREYELQGIVRGLSDKLEAIENGECPTCGHEFVTTEIDAIRGDLSNAEENLREITSSLDKAFEATRTGLMGSIRALEQKLGEFRRKAREVVAAAVKRLEESVASMKLDLETKTKLRETYQRLLEDKQRLENDLHENSVREWSEDNLTRLRKTVAEFQLLLTHKTAVETDHKLYAQKVNLTRKALELKRRERAELGDTEDAPSHEEVERAKADVEKLSTWTQSRRELLERLTVAEVSVNQHRITLARLSDQLASEEKVARWVAICRRAREVLHVKGLPSLMMREYATLLNKRMAYYLRIWEAPFTLQLDENLAFIATFDDGRTHSAARLSGGQRIVASISFRLAMADTFAKQVGLLVLDEPSNYLDEENIQHLQRVLLKLKDLAGTTGKQIIMVTHETSLIGFFDHSISVYR